MPDGNQPERGSTLVRPYCLIVHSTVLITTMVLAISYGFDSITGIVDDHGKGGILSSCSNIFKDDQGYSILGFSIFSIVPLYYILSKSGLMENENRRQIIALIKKDMGITFSSLKECLGLKDGVLAYHLHTLETQQYIKSVKDGKYRRYYPKGVSITGFSSIEEKIILVIRSDPFVSQRRIAKLIGSTPKTVNKYIKKLMRRQVVYLEKEGRCIRYRLTNQDTVQ